VTVGKQGEERAEVEAGGLLKVRKRYEDRAEVEVGSRAGFILEVGLVDAWRVTSRGPDSRKGVANYRIRPPPLPVSRGRFTDTHITTTIEL
jgi:hypothetical protein